MIPIHGTRTDSDSDTETYKYHFVVRHLTLPLRSLCGYVI